MKQMDRPTLLAVLVAGALASSCGGGGGYSAPSAPNPPAANTGTSTDPAATVVGILGDRGASSFSPNPVTAKIGAKIQWRNQDGILHRIVQDKAGDGGNTGDPYGGGPGGSDPSGFDGGDTSPGSMSNAVTLNAAGTVRYHCAIHPGMVGSIVVQ